MTNKIKEFLKKNKKLLLILSGLIALVVVVMLILFLTKPEKVYSVTFDTDGGSVIEKITVKENGTITLPAEPTKEGFQFNGWLLDGSIFIPSIKITKDIQLVAHWIPEGVLTYKVSFLPYNGHDDIVVNVIENTAVDKPIDPTKANSTFKGWFLNGVVYDFTQPVTADIILVAQWEDNKIENTDKVDTTTKKEDETGTSKASVEATGVELQKVNIHLRKGASETLVAKISPSDTTNKTLTWSSNNTAVATVDSAGKVNAVGSGVAKVTVKTVNGKTATASITVTNPVVSLQLSYPKNAVYGGPGSNNSTKFSNPVLTVNPPDADNKGDIRYVGQVPSCSGSYNWGIKDAVSGLLYSEINMSCTLDVYAYVGTLKSNIVRVRSEEELLVNAANQQPRVKVGQTLKVEFTTQATFSKGSNLAECWDIVSTTNNSVTIRGNKATPISSPGNLIAKSTAGQNKTFIIHVDD